MTVTVPISNLGAICAVVDDNWDWNGEVSGRGMVAHRAEWAFGTCAMEHSILREEMVDVRRASALRP